MARSGTVTILYTDLVGSTPVLDRLGDEAGGRLLSAHRALVSEQVRLNGGDALKWLGDGLMAAFESATGALRCALAVRAAARQPFRG
jgi:class 3 adenylate cyclase